MEVRQSECLNVTQIAKNASDQQLTCRHCLEVSEELLTVLECGQGGRVVGAGGDAAGLVYLGAAVGESVVVVHSSGGHPTTRF